MYVNLGAAFHLEQIDRALYYTQIFGRVGARNFMVFPHSSVFTLIRRITFGLDTELRYSLIL